MSCSSGPEIIENGLLVHLDAKNKKSYPGIGTIWYDLVSTSSANMSTNQPVFNVDHFSFNATDDYFRYERSDINAGSYAYNEGTFYMWVRPNSFSTTADNNIFTIESTLEVSFSNKGNGFASIEYASNPWAWRGNTNDALVIGEWNLLTYVHSLTFRKLYVNGVEIFNSVDTGALNAGTATYPYMTLMGRYSGTGSNAYGDLAIISIYSTVHSIDEIKQNFNALRGRFGI